MPEADPDQVALEPSPEPPGGEAQAHGPHAAHQDEWPPAPPNERPGSPAPGLSRALSREPSAEEDLETSAVLTERRRLKKDSREGSALKQQAKTHPYVRVCHRVGAWKQQQSSCHKAYIDQFQDYDERTKTVRGHNFEEKADVVWTAADRNAHTFTVPWNFSALLAAVTAAFDTLYRGGGEPAAPGPLGGPAAMRKPQRARSISLLPSTLSTAVAEGDALDVPRLVALAGDKFSDGFEHTTEELRAYVDDLIRSSYDHVHNEPALEEGHPHHGHGHGSPSQ